LYQRDIRRSYAFDQFMSSQRLGGPGQYRTTDLRHAVSALAAVWLQQVEVFFAEGMVTKYLDQTSDGLPENCYALDDCIAFSHEPVQFALCQREHLSKSRSVRRGGRHMIERF
jgi:hypothetical protein